MTSDTTHTRATRANIRQALKQLPSKLCSGGPVTDEIMRIIGLATLARIHQAFSLKIKGGIDETGDKWKKKKPLKQKRSKQHRSKTRDPGYSADILHKTGALLASLSPDESSPHRIFRVGPGYVIVGTSRPGAADQHRGDPKRHLPQRRLWPPPDRWTAGWWAAILDPVRDGIATMAVALTRETN